MNCTNYSLSQATIYLEKLLANIEAIKGLLTPKTKFMAVIKANAYGHGAVQLAQKMENEAAADYFGVAQLSEALELRATSIESPILVFNSVRPEEIEKSIQQKIRLTVFSTDLAQAIVEKAEELQEEAFVHLKIDSGMGRIGVRNFEDAQAIVQILQSDFVKIEGIYTHFADAEKKAPDNFTHEQFHFFKGILDQFEEEGIHFDLRHASNTAATINYPDYHLDMVRVGIGLYGFNPSQEERPELKLQPIQNISVRVSNVKDFPAEESISYQRTYFSKEKMKVATIGIGYADGVPQALSNKGYFRYQGEKLPILGKVCMDQIILYASHQPDLAIGDRLSYFGDPAAGYSSASDIAELIDSSNYELLCRIGKRVERIYK